MCRCWGHRQQWGQGGTHWQREQEPHALAGATVGGFCGGQVGEGGACEDALLAEASDSARLISARGVPASVSIPWEGLMPNSSTPAWSWANAGSAMESPWRPAGLLERATPGKAGWHAVQASKKPRSTAGHSGPHRSQAAATDRSSHAGISHMLVISQRLLPASRKLAAEPRCSPHAREKSTVHAVTRAGPSPQARPLRARRCTGDEARAFTNKGICRDTAIDALPSQKPRFRTGWLHPIMDVTTASVSCGLSDGV